MCARHFVTSVSHPKAFLSFMLQSLSIKKKKKGKLVFTIWSPCIIWNSNCIITVIIHINKFGYISVPILLIYERNGFFANVANYTGPLFQNDSNRLLVDLVIE